MTKAPSNPELDRQLAFLINRFGVDAVERSLSRLARPKRGRKSEPDHIFLQDFTLLDAYDYLNGRNPLERRSNTHIANEVSRLHPGHSPSATHRRIMRKLSNEREADMKRAAAILSYSEYPFAVHLAALADLARIDPAHKSGLESAEATLSAYRNRSGEPNADMTFQAIHEACVV